MARLILISLAGLNGTVYLETLSQLNLGAAITFAVLAGMACPRLINKATS